MVIRLSTPFFFEKNTESDHFECFPAHTIADVRTFFHPILDDCCIYPPTGKTVVNGGKWVDANGDEDADAGEHVVYQILAVNVGTVTLHSIVLTDGSVTSKGVSCEPAIPESLMPGEGFTCHATYMVSEACSSSVSNAMKRLQNND